jgi:hypothetical protein
MSPIQLDHLSILDLRKIGYDASRPDMLRDAAIAEIERRENLAAGAPEIGLSVKDCGITETHHAH